ncbi:DUF3696 domain-containing protein [Brevibacterium zhoupengii]|uniref:DUF3696 domain-containing protein n=1 Tax=Brevibacterium zhoupengii TaxID=2898795 RepID=UPI001F097FEC|nr:DUF3696 domain-containing protein [Brevibacterium zhoupengii]
MPSVNSSNDDPLRRAIWSIFDRFRNYSSEKVADVALREVFGLWLAAGDGSSCKRELEHRFQSYKVAEPELADIVRAHLEDLVRAVSKPGVFAEIFELVLEASLTVLGRARQEYQSSEVLNSFLGEIIEPPESVFDPACGFGGTLLSMGAPKTAKIVGTELHSGSADVAEMRLRIHGYKHVEIRCSNSLTDGPTAKWDQIVVQPPFGLRPSASEVDPRLVQGHSPRGQIDGDNAWLRLVADSMAPAGKAVIVVPQRSITIQARKSTAISYIIENDWLDASIAIPPGLIPGTQIGATVLVLDRDKSSHKRGKVLVCNAADLVSRHVSPSSTAIKEWLLQGVTPQTPNWQTSIIAAEELLVHGPLPRRYLSEPPTEQTLRPESPGRFLSSVILENFKSISEETEIPLRPLTVVYGKNSAGKSSVLQSLLLLKQSVHANEFAASGQVIDLGSYAGVLNNHNREKTLKIGVKFSSNPKIDSDHVVPSPSENRYVSVGWSNVNSASSQFPSSLCVGLGEKTIELTGNSDEPDTLNLPTDAIETFVGTTFQDLAYYPPNKPTKGGQGKRLAQKLNREKIFSIPISLSNLRLHSISRNIVTKISHFDSDFRRGLYGSYLNRGLAYWSAVGEELYNLVNRMSYIGPLRQSPSRFSHRVEASGRLDMPFYLLDNESERMEVSRWLSRLGTNYELDVVNPIRPEYRDAVGDMASMLLTDSRSGIQVTPADVGFGISQVLPIVTELLVRMDSIVLIEQPEIHLHPAMQAELADLLIESTSASGRANQVIAETHSETLVLRVQRRIREGVLSSDDVAVLYVDQNPDGTGFVQELRLDSSGEFIDSWPNGFFDEQFDEIFGDI